MSTENKEEAKTASEPLAPGVFVDAQAEGTKFLYKTDAFERSEKVSNVRYRMAYALLRGGEHFHGQSKIFFDLNEAGKASDKIFLDYKGDKLLSLKINGQHITEGTPFREHRIYLDQQHLIVGGNTVEIRYVSRYCKDCEGVQVFTDKDDNEEYVYTNHEPASAHKGFPCFDQPDMKASYSFLAVAPRAWTVIANAPQLGSKSHSGSTDFKSKLASFEIDEAEFLKDYGTEATCCFEFGESPRISTYLYAFIAGPYDIFESDKEEIKNFNVPLRLMCRKSVARFLENSKEDYFNTTKSGIEYYEKTFSTPYPFAKLDQVFCPDFSDGAMENVGLITYRDEFIQRDEFFTEEKKQYTRMVILHEVSHMWFGNMVTMKWWDDLWLNESFANFVSYLSLDEGEGTKHYKGAWSMFLDESFWGLTTDQKNTTHPISVEVIHTEAAKDNFDGISYGKGAAWLNQILTLFGREIFKTGIASYFKEYAYKNTSLSDFIRHMHQAAVKCESPIDFEKWSETWLKCAGPNIIWHDITEEAGKITKFTVQQRVHEHGVGNQLRVQKYQCAFYSQDMSIVKVIDIVTKDDQESFEIPELIGQDAPFAYHINYQNKGYAKFIIDEKSTKAFEDHLGKIEDGLSRKHIFLMYKDMLKDAKISGAQLLNICKKLLQTETEVGVLGAIVQQIIPVCVSSYLPLSIYESTHHELFDLILNNILSGDAVLDQSTQSLLFDGLMSHCQCEAHYLLVAEWFKKGKIINGSDKPLDNIEVTLKNKHSMMKRIWSSETIPLAEKEKHLAALNLLDKGDWFDQTKAFCRAAHHENKDLLWNLYFSEDKESECESYGLRTFARSFSGWAQTSHRHLTEKFNDEFFEKIGRIIKNKGHYVSEYYYHFLAPTHNADDASIKKFEDLLAKTLADDPDNTSFIKMLKDSITVLQIKQKGQAASQAYLDAQK